MNLSDSSKLIMALDSDHRAKAVLNKLGESDQFDDWSRGVNRDCVTKFCFGKLSGKRVSLVVTDQPLGALSQLGLNRNQAILVVGNDTRGTGKCSVDREDIHIRSDHDKLETIAEFPRLVGVYKEDKSAIQQAASRIEQVLLDQE